MDPAWMHETGAAILHHLHGDPFPRMVWPTNVTKLGAATMFTLFFAGNDFLQPPPHRRRVFPGLPATPLLRGHGAGGRAAARLLQRAGIRTTERAFARAGGPRRPGQGGGTDKAGRFPDSLPVHAAGRRLSPGGAHHRRAHIRSRAHGKTPAGPHRRPASGARGRTAFGDSTGSGTRALAASRDCCSPTISPRCEARAVDFTEGLLSAVCQSVCPRRQGRAS